MAIDPEGGEFSSHVVGKPGSGPSAMLASPMVHGPIGDTWIQAFSGVKKMPSMMRSRS
jgi:hypothetical protein